jgi:hypothetical protein
MSVGTAVALVLALVSTTLINLAYLREHDAAAELPVLSMRRPLHSAGLLPKERSWLIGVRDGIGGLSAVRGGAGASRARAGAEHRGWRYRRARVRLGAARATPFAPTGTDRSVTSRRLAGVGGPREPGRPHAERIVRSPRRAPVPQIHRARVIPQRASGRRSICRRGTGRGWHGRLDAPPASG